MVSKADFEFTAVPGQNCPKKIQLIYQTQLIKSLKIHLDKISETLSISLLYFQQKIEELDPNRRFSPALFSIYTQIKDAYEKNNMHLLFDALQEFRNLTFENYYSIERTYSTILTESWEYPCIRDLRQSTPHNESGKYLSKEVRMLPLAHWSLQDFPPFELKEAENAMLTTDSDIWNEYETYVTGLKFFSGRVMEGATSPRFFGNIYLRLAYPSENAFLFYFEHIIHELSHLHLYAMMGIDPMVLNPATELFNSPLRVDKRPMFGIFHAAFVLSRILRSLDRYYQKNGSEVEGSNLSQIESSLQDCLKTIGAYGQLTDAGKSVFESMQSPALSS